MSKVLSKKLKIIENHLRGDNESWANGPGTCQNLGNGIRLPEKKE